MVSAVVQAYREAYGGLSMEVWYLSLALLINRCGSMVLAFLTLYLTTKLDFTIIQAGLIFSVYGLGSIAGAYLGGKLIRPIGAIRLQIVSLALSCPCFCIVPIFDSFLGVSLPIFLLSMFSESVRPANNVAIIQFTEPELQTRAFGLQRMALNLGLSIGPAVGGWLADYNFDWLFYVDGVTTLFAAGLMWMLFGFKRYSKTRPEHEQGTDRTKGVGSPLQDPVFLVFLALMMASMFVFFQFHATYPKYLEDHYQMSKPQIGLLYATNTILIVITEMLLVNFVRRFRMLITVGVGGFMSCLGFAMLPCSTAIWFVVWSMIVITIGEMLMFPVATGFVARRSSGRDVGMYMSWYAMTFSFTAVIAPLGGTLLYDVNRHLIWWASGVIGVLVLAAFWTLARQIDNRPDSAVVS
jgi:MFS family permease